MPFCSFLQVQKVCDRALIKGDPPRNYPTVYRNTPALTQSRFNLVLCYARRMGQRTQMMMFTPERHLPTSGQHGSAPSGTPPPAQPPPLPQTRETQSHSAESNKLYRKVKHRARPTLSSRQRPKRAPIRRRSRRRQRRGEPRTEHGLGVRVTRLFLTRT